MTIVETLVRVSAAVASLPLFYVAWFVYEDEEEALQSKIEAWWLQFDDLRAKMLTRQNAFVSVVSARARIPLDRVLGDGRSSKGAIAVALCFCFAGDFFIMATASFFSSSEKPENLMGFGFGFVGLICLFSGLAAVISSRFLLLSKAVVLIFMLLLFGLVGSTLSLFNFDFGAYLYWMVGVTVALSGGIVLTLFSLRLARRSLILAEQTHSEWRAVPFLLIAALILFVPLLLLLPLALPITDARVELIFIPISLAVGGASVAVCYVGLILGTATVMMLHRIVWPLLSRFLYILPRHRILENKKSLNAVAVGLLTVAFGGGYFKQVLSFLGT
jgi:hypothetical protein